MKLSFLCRTFLCLLVPALLCRGAAIEGTVVNSPITLGNDGALTGITNKHIGNSAEMKGTPKTVTSIMARNDIPTARRTEGMTCYVTTNQVTYVLVGGIADANWVASTTGGVGTGDNANALTNSEARIATLVSRVNTPHISASGTFGGVSSFGVGSVTNITKATDITMPSGGDSYNAYPSIVLTPSNRLVMAYGTMRDHFITNGRPIITRSADFGETWSAPFTNIVSAQSVFPAGLTVVGADLVMTYCVNSTNIHTIISHDEGLTWVSDTLVASNYDNGRVSTASGITVLTDGRWMLPIYGNDDGSWNRSSVIFSSDQGTTWINRVHLATDNTNIFSEAGIHYLEDGTTLMALIRNDLDSLSYRSTSTDNGATWTTPALVGLADIGSYNDWCIVRPGIIAAWTRVSGLNGTSAVKTSEDNGLTWSPPLILSTAGQGQYAGFAPLAPGVVACAWSVEDGALETTNGSQHFSLLFHGSAVGHGVFMGKNFRTPDTLAVPNYILTATGTNGESAWAAQSVSPPAGQNLQVQVNSNGVFAGSPKLTFNATNGSLSVYGNVPGDVVVNIQNTNTGGYGLQVNAAGSGSEYALKVLSSFSTLLNVNKNGNVTIGGTGNEAMLHLSGGSMLLDNSKIIGWKAAGGTPNVWQLFADPSDKFLISGVGGTALAILPSGNVGIRTATPAAPLHVYAGVSGDVVGIVQNTNVNGYGLSIFTAGSGTEYALSVGSGFDGATFRVINNGNIGIGTATPASKLQIVGGGVLLDNNRIIGWKAADGTPNYWQVFNGSTDKFTLVGGGGSTFVTVLPSGNVGIGTTTPVAKLDVNGNIKTLLTNASLATDGNGIIVAGGGSGINLPITVTTLLGTNGSNAGGLTRGLVYNTNGAGSGYTALEWHTAGSTIDYFYQDLNGLRFKAGGTDLVIEDGIKIVDLSGTGTRFVTADPDGVLGATGVFTGDGSGLTNLTSVIKAGTTNITALTAFTVVFASAFPTTNYTALAIGNGFALAAPYAANKTTTSVTFNFGIATGLIDWQAVLHTQ